MPGLALDPGDGCVGVGAAHDAQDGFVAVRGIFNGNEEGGPLGLGDGVPAVWLEVGGVAGGGESVVKSGEIGGEVWKEEEVIVVEEAGFGRGRGHEQSARGWD